MGKKRTFPAEKPASVELREIRLDVVGMTQRAMAQALRVQVRTYQRYERGEVLRVPSNVLDRARALSTLMTKSA